MKKFLLVSAGMFLLHFTYGQNMQPCMNCLPQGITFTAQSQIDSFSIDYPNCTRIEGYVYIYGNNIANLNGLTAVTYIGGFLRIESSNNLHSLMGLNNLDTVGDGLEVKWCMALPNLEGLNNLKSIGVNLYVLDCDSLENLNGLYNLTTISGDLVVAECKHLTSLSGLNNLVSIGDVLKIQSCPVPNLGGLGSLMSIQGGVHLSSCYALTSLSGMEGVTGIGGDIWIEYCHALTNLSGCDNITSLSGALYIDACNGLITLDGLNNLISIGAELAIMRCNYFYSFEALQNLTSIGGYLQVVDCGNIHYLTGLDNIEPGSIADLYLAYNSQLTDCAVKSICDYLESPGGTVTIGNNYNGCSNVSEVQAACEQLIIPKVNPTIKIHVNYDPVSSCLVIVVPVDLMMTIYRVDGKQVMCVDVAQGETTFKTTDWDRGLYLTLFDAGTQRQTNRFIVY